MLSLIKRYKGARRRRITMLFSAIAVGTFTSIICFVSYKLKLTDKNVKLSFFGFENIFIGLIVTFVYHEFLWLVGFKTSVETGDHLGAAVRGLMIGVVLSLVYPALARVFPNKS